MSAVTDNRDDKFAIFPIVGEYLFESIRQVEKFFSLAYSTFKDFWFHICSHGPTVRLNTESFSFLPVKRCFWCLGGQNTKKIRLAFVHAALNFSLGSSSYSGCHIGHSTSISKVISTSNIPFLAILVVDKLRVVFIISPWDHIFVRSYNGTPVSQRGFQLVH